MEGRVPVGEAGELSQVEIGWGRLGWLSQGKMV
jgi:hypothetical protein